MYRRVLGVAALGLALTGCSAWGPEGGPFPRGASPAVPAVSPDAAPAQAATASATPGADGVQRITVTVDDRLRYAPAVIRARTGTLEITVRNTGTTPHTLAGPALNAAVDNVDGGGTRTVRLTFAQPGRYTFGCSYHTANGMTGIIEVTGGP